MQDIKITISQLPNLSAISYFLIKRLAKTKKNILFLSSCDDLDFYDLDSYTAAIAKLDGEETFFETLFWADDESLNIKTLNILDKSEKEKKPLIIFSSPSHILKDIFSKEEYLRVSIQILSSLFCKAVILSMRSDPYPQNALFLRRCIHANRPVMESCPNRPDIAKFFKMKRWMPRV